jgi:hypothetical protein
MALDFTTASLDARVTVTRALNTATAVNSSGYIAAVNANLPRFDYNPTAPITCKGLLIEESRANLFLQSEALTSPWVIDGGGSLNATPTAAPDNANTAKKLQENTANTYFRAYQEVTLTNGAVYTASVFAKPSGRDWLFLYFSGGTATAYVNIATKTVGTTTGSPTITFTDYANGFVRVTMVFTNTSVGGQNVQVWLGQSNGVRTYQGDGSSGMYIWGFQIELGAFATSYIPTTTTSLTRNADVVDMTGTNFSDWYNATEGSIYAEYTPFTVSGATRGVFSINDGSANNYADWRPNGGDFVVTSGGAGQADMYPGGITVNTVGKGVLALKANSMACAINGGAVSSDNTALMPVSPNKLNIGRLNNNAALSICGWMRKISYWPQRLTDAEVRAFSK